MRHFIPVGAFFLIITSAAAVRADSLDSFKKDIQAKLSSHKSIQYKAKVVTEIVNEQMSIKSTTDQTAQYVKQGDKVLSHSESKMASDQKIGEMNQKNESTSVDICDGQYSYHVTESGGQKAASKHKVDPKKEISPFDAKRMFEVTEEQFTLKLLPVETVDGKAAYVLELTMKEAPAGMPMGKTKVYYDKATGLSLKSISYDDKGKAMTTMTTSDVKVDANIPADRFVFKAPAGVTVQDSDKGE